MCQLPRILDLELSMPRFIGRIIAALILAGIEFFFLYVLISPNASFLENLLPASLSPIFSAMHKFVTPTLPIIGLAIAFLIFFDQIFKKTKIEGAFLIVMSSLFAWYTYNIFQGGTMHITIPTGIVQNVTGDITVSATLIMWLLILPSLLSIVKGGLMLLHSNRKPANEI